MTPRHALIALAPAYPYRAVLDADGCPIIPGLPRRLEWHGAQLVFYMEHSRLLDGPEQCREGRGWSGFGHQEAPGCSV